MSTPMLRRLRMVGLVMVVAAGCGWLDPGVEDDPRADPVERDWVYPDYVWTNGSAEPHVAAVVFADTAAEGAGGGHVIDVIVDNRRGDTPVRPVEVTVGGPGATKATSSTSPWCQTSRSTATPPHPIRTVTRMPPSLPAGWSGCGSRLVADRRAGQVRRHRLSRPTRRSPSGATVSIPASNSPPPRSPPTMTAMTAPPGLAMASPDTPSTCWPPSTLTRQETPDLGPAHSSDLYDSSLRRPGRTKGLGPDRPGTSPDRAHLEPVSGAGGDSNPPTSCLQRTPVASANVR